MRIGIEMMGAQSPTAAGGGIERVTHSLVTAMTTRDPDTEYLLYYYDCLPRKELPLGPNCRSITLSASAPGTQLRSVLDRLVQTNPDRLDLLLLTHPMEILEGFAPPASPLNGLKMASVVHDLIPGVFHEQYLENQPFARNYYQALEKLRGYDLLLAVSEATRADCEKLLGSRPGQLAVFGNASDSAFFMPADVDAQPAQVAEALAALGITKPYVFTVSGLDQRKNFETLVAGFRLLSPEVRQAHQLVITRDLNETSAQAMRQFAEQCGVAEQLVLTNRVPDTTLRLLYQQCAAFVFTSKYEGFGLPLLEAMLCGAAVLAGNNSSQPEVVGQAGILVNVEDAADIATRLQQVLCDRDLAALLRSRALVQAQRYSWEQSADRACAACRRVLARPAPLFAHSAGKPKIAYFSPFPPKRSGISDYSTSLVEELCRWYSVDLYHDAGYVPHAALKSPALACFDYRLFDRNAAQGNYRQILYQMGNSPYHGFIHETLMRHPGIVTVHDFALGGLHRWISLQKGVRPDFLEREFDFDAPHQAGQLPALLNALGHSDAIDNEFLRRNVYLNRRIFDRAVRVVLHDQWGLAKVRELFPEYLDRTVHIPHGMTPLQVAAARKQAIRREHNLAASALVVGCFGILHPHKMNVEAIKAFALVAQRDPSAVLLFVGRDCGNGEARTSAAALGLEHRVRFLGHQMLEAFRDLMAVTDIGLALRRPPTRGETSGALLHLLAAGVPTIVTDVDAFSSFPEEAVSKVPWDEGGLDSLGSVLLELAQDRQRRQIQGLAAESYIRAVHLWPRVAARYADLIEQVEQGSTLSALCG